MNDLTNHWAYKFGKRCRRWLGLKPIVEEVKPIQKHNQLLFSINHPSWAKLLAGGEFYIAFQTTPDGDGDFKMTVDCFGEDEEAKSLKEWNDALKTLTERGQ